MKKTWIKLLLFATVAISVSACTVTKYQYYYYPAAKVSAQDSTFAKNHAPNKVY